MFFVDILILIAPLVSFCHCIVYSSSIYWFWLHLWYLLAIVLSVLRRFTDSDYPFGIFWPLYCLFIVDLLILITPLVSFGHCIVCSSSIYWFWLPLWYLLAIVLSVLRRFTDSDCTFGIFWPLYCLVLSDLLILISLWYLLAIVFYVLRRFTDSDCPFGIFWPFYFLFFVDLLILITPLVSFGHCIVCSSSIYWFGLPLWYLLAIVLSVLRRFTDSDYPFGIFWPLYVLFFVDLLILITTLVSFGHCIVCSSSIYWFWLPLWYLLAIVLSVLRRFTDSDYPFGIFWPLFCLFLVDLLILIAFLISFGHCIVCSSSIYWFWLSLWYLLAIVLCFLRRFTDSDCPFGIFWPLYCLFFVDLLILITSLVSFGHCIVCSSSIYWFWLPLWYLLTIVLCVLRRLTDSDYPFGIFWPLYCLFFVDLLILIAFLISLAHCIVCSSSIYWFWLPLWYLLAIVFSVLRRFTDSDYPFGIFWPLYCLFFVDLLIRIAPLVSFGHCIVCSASIYWFWLPLWYLLAMVLSVPRRFIDSDCFFDIFWPLYCLIFVNLLILIVALVSFGHCIVCSSSIYWFWLPLWYLLAIVFSVLRRFTDSDYPFGIFWPLYCLFFVDLLILITPLVPFGHCIVCSSSIYWFWLPLWYLLAIVFSVLRRFTDSDYPFGIFWPLYCLFFVDLLIRIAPLVSFGHCIVCSASIYWFWLPLWYLLAIVLSVPRRFIDSDCFFDIFWPLYCLFFVNLLILIVALVSFGHCIVCSSSIYWFWLPLWYLLAIVFSVLRRFTDSDYPFGIFWPLYCLFFVDLLIRIAPLVSFGHCIVCSASIYWFWLPLWYLLAIVLSVHRRFIDSDCFFDIFWPLYCLFFVNLLILIVALVSFGHCIVFSSSIYWFWLPLWYLLALVLSVLRRFTNSDYLFGIFWPLYCLFFVDLLILIAPLVSFGHCIFWPLYCVFFVDWLILITPLVSFGHCIVCSSSIYWFWLPFWYLLAIALSVLRRFTDSDYPFGIFWPLYCLFFVDLLILITPLVSFGHCIVCSSSIYWFWLPLWYLLAIVLSVLRRFTDSDCPFGIFWPLYCLFFVLLAIVLSGLERFTGSD